MNPLRHVLLIQLLASEIYVQDQWHILIWDECMCLEIVYRVTLNSMFSCYT
ncbi:hypothetical protein E2C01_091458 [Portunus trituberculatus]|uniref:Uncharacterized protein n=1 Tax=Portunus trituberculatus TaxID=210409 RepID=A0A5B7JV32_PORTR|nr:hypothetical protein [Portunus trituberculatus]